MTELLNSGIELMLVGMGIVFAFLTMLVLVIRFMSGFILRHFPDKPAPAKTQAGSGPNLGTIAAISAAVHHYRSRHKRQ